MIWEARLYRHLAIAGYDFEGNYPAVDQKQYEVVGSTRPTVTAHWHGRRLILAWPGEIKFGHVRKGQKFDGVGLVRDGFVEVCIEIDTVGRPRSAGGSVSVWMDDGVLVTVRSYAERGNSVGDTLQVVR